MFHSVIIAVVIALPGWAFAAPDSAGPVVVEAPRRARVRVAQATPVKPVKPADAAAAAVRTTLSQLAQTRRELRRLRPVYELQLKAVDRLKRRRASWRRDNQIRSQLKKAQSIAKRLGVVAGSTRMLHARLRSQRVALRSAVSAELRGQPSPVRRGWLRRMAQRNRRALRGTSRKIVMPDARIDPLADPEDLDDQAARILQAERRLAQEIAILSRRSKRYKRMVKLRQKRQRAADLGGLDDNRPRRSTGRLSRNGGRDSGDGAGLSSNDDFGSPAPTGASETTPQDPSALDSDPLVVLADVVDSRALTALRRAASSTDPAVKARAAARVQREVRARLERLRKRRLLIQRRAKQLRRR